MDLFDDRMRLMDTIMSTNLTRFIWLGAMWITAPNMSEERVEKEIAPLFNQSVEYLQDTNELNLGQQGIQELIGLGFPDVAPDKLEELVKKYINIATERATIEIEKTIYDQIVNPIPEVFTKAFDTEDK